MEEALNKLDGVTCNPAEGSMYVFPRIRLPKGALDAAKEVCLRLPLLSTSSCVLSSTGLSLSDSYSPNPDPLTRMHPQCITLAIVYFAEEWRAQPYVTLALGICPVLHRAASQSHADVLQAGKPPDFFYCKSLLEAKGIVTVPGAGFKQAEGTLHFRTTILPPESDIEATAKDITDFHKDFMAKVLPFRLPRLLHHPAHMVARVCNCKYRPVCTSNNFVACAQYGDK